MERGRALTALRPPGRRVCSFENCGKYVEGDGLCSGHRYQRKRGQPLRSLRFLAPAGSGTITTDGYLLVTDPSHPNARKSGQVFEHVRVMSQLIGRPLLPGENVHHKNGVRDDNRPENLELWVSTQPSGQRPEDLVAWAKIILERYGTPGLLDVGVASAA